MGKFDYKSIIAEAWETTQTSKRLIYWYAIPPAIISTLAGILTLLYQYYALKSSPMFENWEYSFTSLAVREVFYLIRDNTSLIVPFIVAIIIIAILYFLVPPMTQGAMIQLIARKRNGQDIRLRDGITYGLVSFLPLFEYTTLVRTFSFFSAFTWASFIGRNINLNFLLSSIPYFILFIIVGFILTLLFTYTEFFIVIDERKVIDSISKSSGLVVTHLAETLLLSILMLIIGIRILIQILFVLLIPAAIISAVYLLALATLPIIAISVGTILGLVLLYVAAYLNATIQVFAIAVWTYTFLEFTSEDNISAREKAAD
jgi:hypothetical protein